MKKRRRNWKNNKYAKSIIPRIIRSDAVKLADWTNASHVENAAKKPKMPTP